MRRSSVQFRWVAPLSDPGLKRLGSFHDRWVTMQTGATSPSSLRLAAWLQRFRRLLSHPLWLLLLLGLAALAFAAHQWLPQAPTSLAADAAARSSWQSMAASTLPAGSFLNALGLFDLAHNPSLRILLALLTATLVLRLLDAIYLVWATRHLAPPDRWLPGVASLNHQQTGAADFSDWETTVAKGFGRWQRTSITDATAAESYQEAVGDRNHAYTWAGILVELGLMVALLAMVLNLRSGWQIDALSLDPGHSASLAPFSADFVRLDEAGAVLELCCQRPRSAALTNSLRLGAPGLRLQVQQVGPALALSALADGQIVPLQAVEQSDAPAPMLILRFPQERSERAAALPDRALFLRVVALPDGQFSIQALDAANNLLLTESIAAASDLVIGDLTLEVRPSRYAVISVTARPWQWLFLPALLLLLAGFVLRWRFPYMRLGIRLNEGGAALRWQGQWGGRPTLDQVASMISAPEREQPTQAAPNQPR